jgi:hypothetical protein
MAQAATRLKRAARLLCSLRGFGYYYQELDRIP